MTGFFIAWGVGVAVIIALALILPCEGCRLRRERMRQAMEALRRRKSGTEL